ncbi:hypothetical protein [Methanoculleus bourgensis]|uniref:hypothetical protein n=1 Tax=Methanoculleus bourgensis TaxID=83986 RepID=UPI0022EEAA14|nr:hypothetical protein [Methanoculleus bourgensis]GLI46256.1 hypothetical protein MBOURGENBZM_10480 [Methanoculleus bourgensis]
MEKGSLEKIGAAFTEMNRHFEEMYQATFAIPEEALRERKNGSMQVAAFHVNWVFGEADGYEYLEFYRFHRFGDEHARIWEDGTIEQLDTLETMFAFDPKIPGDEERKSEESARRYENLLKELAEAGLLEEMPYHTMVNSFLVLRKEEMQ